MIKVILKPEKGIQIDETKKYLFDPSVVQSYVDSSAENATKAEEQANRVEQAFTDVSAFVDTSKSEITGIIEQGKTEISTAIDDGRMEISDSILEATEEVKKAGLEAAQEAVQGAADEATRIATEQVNTYVVDVVSPQIQEFVNNAEADASNAAESAGLAAEEANKSSVFASDSQHYAEDARIWAEGEQAEVKPLGGSLSSMGAADLAYAIANAPEDTPIDTSNLFALNIFKGEKGDKGDKGDAGKDGKIGIESFATNCITEIPQDIKLELADGTLTLKAGSKVYVPNGSGVFDEVTVASDKSVSVAQASKEFMLCYNVTNHEVWFAELSSQKSGVSPSGDGFYYNTSSNKVVFLRSGVADSYEFSLPIAIVTSDSTQYTSIDQVFNGFGYIGSTVFALPNVKGLIPDGRNADGSLRNIEWNCSSVVTRTFSSSENFNGTACGFDGSAFSRLGVGSYSFSETENLNKNGKDMWVATHIDDNFVLTGGSVTSFAPKLPFRAVDRNDSSWIAAQAMPSKKQLDLALGATGSTYTAPANGYFYANQQSTVAGQYISFTAFGATRAYSSSSSQSLQIFLPVPKGETLTVDYTAPTNRTFRFYYAKGEN